MPPKEKLPNQLFHMALVTAHEIVGANGMKSLLGFAHLSHFIDNYPPPDLNEQYKLQDFTRLMSGFVEIFGEQGARAIMMRGGMVAFRLMLEQFPSLFKIEDMKTDEHGSNNSFAEFERIYGIIIDASVSIFGDVLRYYQCEEGVALDIAPCHFCADLKTNRPICSGNLGFEKGVAQWVLGTDITIEETHCMAVGDPMCRFVMHRP